jgi:hypothetical protein
MYCGCDIILAYATVVVTLSVLALLLRLHCFTDAVEVLWLLAQLLNFSLTLYSVSPKCGCVDSNAVTS